jgi:hypothetical protein
VPSLRKVQAARNTWAVDVDRQLLGSSAVGDCLADVILPDISLPNVRLHDVRPGGTVGEKGTRPAIAEE